MLSIRLQAVLIFIGGLLLFTVGLQSQEVIGFESRFYLFALEAWRHGLHFFPTTYQHPYPDYPATATGLIYLVSKIVGGVSKFTAVFPSACASAVTLAVTYLIGALHSRRLGWMAVLFLLFTITFFATARTISLDQFTTAITTVCFYLVYSASEKRKTHRVLWIFPLFVLGFAFRGPIGLIIPVSVVCLFYLLDKNFKRVVTVGLTATLLLVGCCVVLLWAAHHAGGPSFMHDVLQMEVFGRMQDVKPLPIYFYFQESFGAYAVTFPLAILVLLSLLSRTEAVEDERFLIKLLGWAGVILIGLSIPADKKIRYILSAAPAFALICGYLFVAKRDNNYLYVLRNMFIWFCFYFPLLCLAAVFFVHHRYPDLFFLYRGILMILAVLQLIMLLCIRHQKIIFPLAVATFVFSYIAVIEPINLALNRTRDFVLQIEALRQGQHAQLAFYREGVDGLVVKYLVSMPKEEMPLFLNGEDDLAKIKGPVVVVMTELNAQQLSAGTNLHLMAHGRIGHEPVAVFNQSAN